MSDTKRPRLIKAGTPARKQTPAQSAADAPQAQVARFDPAASPCAVLLDALAEPTPAQHGTWAMVIQTHGQTLTTDQAYLGSKVSYQQALWTGALTTLHRIEADSGGLPVDFCTDDQALVRTLQNHPAQAGAPEGLVYQARELLARLPNVTLRWINGTDNRPADDLSVATWAASLGLSPAEARTEIDALREQRRADKRKKRQKSAAK